MRRAVPTLLLLCALAAGATGCGEESSGAALPEEPTAIPQERLDAPTPTPTASQAQPLPAKVRAQLAAGEVGLFDVFGRTSVRPSTVVFAADSQVEDVDWSRWAPEGATGTGTMRFNDCDPNCVDGDRQAVPATVTLREPRSCDGRLYFATGKVTTDAGPRVTSYLRAPC